MNLDHESVTQMFFDHDAKSLQYAEWLARCNGHQVGYPISGDELARIRAAA